MRMSEKCRNNNNSDNPLTSRRTIGGKNLHNRSIWHFTIRYARDRYQEKEYTRMLYVVREL